MCASRGCIYLLSGFFLAGCLNIEKKIWKNKRQTHNLQLTYAHSNSNKKKKHQTEIHSSFCLRMNRTLGSNLHSSVIIPTKLLVASIARVCVCFVWVGFRFQSVCLSKLRHAFIFFSSLSVWFLLFPMKCIWMVFYGNSDAFENNCIRINCNLHTINFRLIRRDVTPRFYTKLFSVFCKWKEKNDFNTAARLNCKNTS